MKTIQLSIYCDGGARGNPGPAASAFVVQDSSGKILHEQGFYLGPTTNNQAEYEAVIQALKWVSTLHNSSFNIHFFLDSLLVVNQLKGLYKVKNQNLLSKFSAIKELIIQYSIFNIQYSYIPRAQNFRADLLVNQTLDSEAEK